jgi:hypothetical protein
MSWKDCHVEYVTLFHFHVDMFMHQHILINNGILRKIKEYVICYELQHHGYVHAHIVLWVDDNDLEKVTNEIIACIPTIFDKTIKIFMPPNDSLQFKLFKMVLRNQLHEFQKNCIRNLGRNGNCKFGFPFLPCIESIF